MNYYEHYKWISQCHCFEGLKPWKTVVFFGGIHWNEPSWIEALATVVKDLKQWVATLLSWKLIIVTHWNIQAISDNKRYLDYDMNRLFSSSIDLKQSSEHTRASELMHIIDEADIFIDLHSTSNPSKPFLFCEKEDYAYMKDLWIEYIVVWWSTLENAIVWDTETYARSKGAISCTYESWSHTSPMWTYNALELIYRILQKEKMIIWWAQIKSTKQYHIQIEWVYKTINSSFRYIIPIENFQKIPSWTLLWYDGSSPVYIKNDCVLVLPKAESAIKQWKEAFFRWTVLD